MTTGTAAGADLSVDLLDGTAATTALLSSLMLTPPDPEALARLRSAAELEWPFPDAEGSTPEAVLLLCAPVAQAEVAADHLRLFGGAMPALAPPHESVYRSEDHLLFGEVTMQVREAYARHDLAAPAGGRPTDDHAGLELAFVAHLCLLVLDALDRGDHESAQAIATDLRAFWSEHLLTWLPAFAGLVTKNADTTLYRGVGLLLAEEARRWTALTP